MREREQPGKEEQEQDVREVGEHPRHVGHDDEAERDHAEDEDGVEQPTLALGELCGHGDSLRRRSSPALTGWAAGRSALRVARLRRDDANRREGLADA